MDSTDGLVNSIAVAIPTYNRNEYLEKLMSTIPADVKISVSDNGAYVSQQLKDKYQNASFISHPDVIDVFSNWNAAAQNVSSQWVVIPSDDDLFLPGAFNIIDRYISKYPDVDILIFGHNIIDEHDNIIGGWQYDHEETFLPPNAYELFKFDVKARMPGIVFKTSRLKELNFFDQNYKLTAGDSDLIQRFLLSAPSVFLSEIIGYYRVWEGNLTSKRMATKLWLSEIDYWQDKIKHLGQAKYPYHVNKIDFDFIKDEVYANNLLGGILIAKGREGFGAALRFLLSVRFPWKAYTITKLRIIKALLK